MRYKIVAPVVALLFLCSQAYAQVSVHKPARSQGQRLHAVDALRTAERASAHVILPQLTDSEQTLRQARLNRADEFRLLTYAQERQLPVDIVDRGEWLRTDEGDYVWRLQITSPAARGLALCLEDCTLPRGSAVYAYGSGGGQIGALTEQNNNPNRLIQLAPLSGETITLEYELPQGETPERGQRPPFVLRTLEHDFVGLQSRRDALRRGSAGPGEPSYNALMPLERMSCAPNVLTQPQWRRQARSVVILAVGGAMSTGALINTPRSDGRAYVLTAAHAINGAYYVDRLADIKAMVRHAVFFFGFESPSPRRNIRATEEMSLSGAELVAYDPESDMALLEITGLPRDASGVSLGIPTAYNAYFSGWNITPTPRPPFVGIHHPAVMTKRYSQAQDDRLEVVDYSTRMGALSWEMRHWHLKRWFVGSTAAGSSGSPLYDAEGLIIGALTGGRSDCPSNGGGRPENDYYYALHRTWRAATPLASLGNYLDPDGTGATSCPGYDPHEADVLYRLSDLYAVDGVETRAVTAEGAEGLGRIVEVEGSAKLLGAYIVFQGRGALEEQFPELLIELSPYRRADGEVSAPVWSTRVSSAQYRYFEPRRGVVHTADGEEMQSDYTQGTWREGPRTLSRDTIELFVPSDQLAALPAGEYLVGVRRADGQGLDLPILQSVLPRTTTHANIWTYASGQWHSVGAERPRQVWVDLLVQSPTEQTAKARPVGLSDQIDAYYHGGVLRVRIPEREGVVAMRLFSPTGKLVRTTTLSAGEHALSLDLVAQTVYVVELSGISSRKVFKFIAQ